MPPFGFPGPCYQSRSIQADCEVAVNLYPELVESGHSAGKSRWVEYGTPGKTLFCTLGGGPIACIVSSNQQFAVDSVTPMYFAIAGQTLYSIAVHIVGSVFTGVATSIGTVAEKTGLPSGALFPAQIIVISPNVLFVVADGQAFVASFGSAINTAVVGAGGNNYANGDTGYINGTGGQVGVYTVTGVTGGAVTSFTFTVGSGYSTGIASTTPGGVQPGSGDSTFTVNITAVAAAAWSITAQTIPDNGAGNYIQTAAYIDSYVVVSVAGNSPDPARRQFFVSQVGCPSIWNPLAVGTKEANSDPMVAVFAAYETLFLHGLDNIEVWYDNPPTGGAVFNPFQRIQGGGVIENGLASPWTIAKMDGSIAWVGTDNRGQLVAWLLRGLTPVRISNHAVEYAWRNYDVTGSSAFSYQEDGHFFFVVNFPIPKTTWVADTTTLDPEGKPCWHQRSSGGISGDDYGRYHAFAFPVGHVVGDYRNGNLYIQNIDILSENGANISRLRISPHLIDQQRRILFTRFRLFADVTGPGLSVSLSLSNDGGVSFGTPIAMSPSAQGFMDWLRLGISTNRAYAIQTSSQAVIAFIEAWSEGIETVNP